MTENKPKIVIIEDDYYQYQIIRNLLKRDYEIFHNIENAKDFKILKPKLIRLLKDEDNSFENALEGFKNVSAFVVDYELKEGSRDKTGVLFCKKIESISNGKTPALFLTKEAGADITNEITKVKKEVPGIIYDFSRKPENWAGVNNTKKVNDAVSESVVFYNNDIKYKLNEMLKKEKTDTIVELCNKILQKGINKEKYFTDTIESIKSGSQSYNYELIEILQMIINENDLSKEKQKKYIEKINNGNK